MAVITVRFVTSNSFISRSIRWATNSLFSHVEFGTPEGTWIGAHAGEGVQERAANYSKPTLDYIYDVPCADSQQAYLLRWARSQIGTKYNLMDIGGLLLHTRKLDTPGRVICSEFCTDGLLKTFGPYKVLNVLPEYSFLVTPEMLHLSPLFTGHRRK